MGGSLQGYFDLARTINFGSVCPGLFYLKVPYTEADKIFGILMTSLLPHVLMPKPGQLTKAKKDYELQRFDSFTVYYTITLS